MLSLRKTPQGIEYYELKRSQPGSLPAANNHQGGLADAEDELDVKMFSVPGSERCLVKTLKNYVDHHKPTSDAPFQRRRDSQSKKFNPTDDKIWFCNSPRWHNYARQNDEKVVKASRYRATSHKPLPHSYICHIAL